VNGMTETALTEIVDASSAPASVARAASARLRPRTARVIAEVGRVGLVALALAVVYGSQTPLSDKAVVPITVAAAIWLICLRAASSPDVLLFGRVLSQAFGAALGFVGVALLNGSAVGLHLSWPALAGAALGVMTTTMVWDAFANLVLAARRRVLFVGTDAQDVMLPEDVGRCRQLGFEIVGSSEHTFSRNGSAPGDILARDELAQVVEAQDPDILVLTDEATFERALESLLDARTSIRVASLAGFCEYALGRVPIEHIGPTWFMSLVHLRQNVYSRRSKRVFDIVASVIGLVVAAPVIAVMALLTKTTPGPVLHRQARVGEGGRNFTVYKIRTMRCDAEAHGPTFTCEDDCRVTRVGRVLRRTHLDELPQLWNVLKGEMSMVGPRPERPEFIEMIEDSVPFWNRRVLVKPGVTGWAQILGDYASDCDGMTRKLSYDLWYLRHGSLLVDVAICLETVALQLRALVPGRLEKGMGR
jgi:exopolysaccharide biosynthesis polyprenyl glycosylphosphotransferase